MPSAPTIVHAESLPPVPSPEFVRVWADLDAETAELLAFKLAQENLGLTPADPEWTTPSDLAAQMIAIALRALVGRRPRDTVQQAHLFCGG